jgi:hypothetical protein
MNKTWVIVLAALSTVLAGTTITLAIILYRHQRFTPTNGSSPYIMFDTRTAQACWSGPPTATGTTDKWEKYRVPEKPKDSAGTGFDWSGFSAVGQDKPSNPPNLPFCKDLK